MIDSFPLQWPMGYKRTNNRIYSRFKTTMDRAQNFLHDEIKRLGGKDLIVSSDVPTRKDGIMYSDWMRRKIDDPGVAIYFKYNDKDVVMCCDQYLHVWENIYALGKGIEALRGMERWGVSEFMERAFTGFKQIAESVETETWFQILKVDANADESEIKDAYRKRAKECHPDVGGSPEQFARIKNAYDQGMMQVR